jgi:hypothetical protein
MNYARLERSLKSTREVQKAPPFSEPFTDGIIKLPLLHQKSRPVVLVLVLLTQNAGQWFLVTVSLLRKPPTSGSLLLLLTKKAGQWFSVIVAD